MIHWTWLIPAAIAGAFLGIFSLALIWNDDDE